MSSRSGPVDNKDDDDDDGVKPPPNLEDIVEDSSIAPDVAAAAEAASEDDGIAATKRRDIAADDGNQTDGDALTSDLMIQEKKRSKDKIDEEDDVEVDQTAQDVVARIDIVRAANLPKEHSNWFVTVYSRSMQPNRFQTSLCAVRTKTPEWHYHFFVIVSPKCEDFLVCINVETLTGEETVAKVRVARPVKVDSRDFYGGWQNVDLDESEGDKDSDFVRPKILLTFRELYMQGIERHLETRRRDLFEAAKRYLDPLEYSLLVVHVLEARRLKKADWFGLSDPYVKITFTENDAWPYKWKSSIIKQNLNPQWNETTYFLLAPAHDHFLIEVYDDDGKWKKDDFLGRVHFPLAREYMEHKAWRALDEGEGEILVRYFNIPLSAIFESPSEMKNFDAY
eukprot:TRINITY_DN6452_c0_g1_i1.p1 TRINITY_DN6452_c0_g1~~TRINITY_DN6452_c0_g1_i1.p1  ORF type:complete len:395 (-),score=99.89 TRINITY_DN6452_c0_g1_i1:1104-2288(-)